MKKQILITIGREYGSGGHDLAALLSQRLGIRMLDRELIDELWKNDPEMQQLAQQYDERPVNRILSRKINEFDNSIPHNVAQRQFDMIRQIADSGESAIFLTISWVRTFGPEQPRKISAPSITSPSVRLPLSSIA